MISMLVLKESITDSDLKSIGMRKYQDKWFEDTGKVTYSEVTVCVDSDRSVKLYERHEFEAVDSFWNAETEQELVDVEQVRKQELDQIIEFPKLFLEMFARGWIVSV